MSNTNKGHSIAVKEEEDGKIYWRSHEVGEARDADSFRRHISALQIVMLSAQPRHSQLDGKQRQSFPPRLLTSCPFIGLNKTAIKSAVVNVECVCRCLSVFHGNMSSGEHHEQLTSIKKCAWPVFTPNLRGTNKAIRLGDETALAEKCRTWTEGKMQKATLHSMQGTAAPLGHSEHVLQPTAQMSGPEQGVTTSSTHPCLSTQLDWEAI